MYTEKDKDLVLKFIWRNYPIARIKYKMRFRRAIVLDNGDIFFLCEYKSKDTLKYHFLQAIKKAFDFDEAFVKSILENYLT
jgi:hypothetical protein